jgi:protein ImuA
MGKSRSDIIQELRQDLLLLNGFPARHLHHSFDFGLPELEYAFPNHTFPLGVIHDFTSFTNEDRAATSAFVSCIAGKLLQKGGICTWISISRLLFPAALASFNIQPDKVVFIDVKKEKDALWVMEEALKCEQLSSVVGETRNITFTESRRLQLAVEKSKVTGFLLRHQPAVNYPVAAVSKWQITSLASEIQGGMPGVGFPGWNVELLKVRNGRPGTWQVQWNQGKFKLVPHTGHPVITDAPMRKAG